MSAGDTSPPAPLESPGGAPPGDRSPRRAVAAIAVGALTALALVLRLIELDQSLFGDEIFTFDIVTGEGIGDVLTTVRDTSITPPLHYVLAWLAVQLGDPEVTVRLPSLLLGTATVPVVHALGVRTVGTAAAVAGALVVAVGPFALFYGTEARAYATLIFLIALAALALVQAVRPGASRWWWVLWAGCAAGAMYTHYTALFPLAAQAVWALWAHRREWKSIAVSCAGAALLWLPWAPAYLEQRRNEGIDAIEALYDLTLSELARGLVQVVAGLPFEPLRAVPGTAGLIALGGALAAGLAALAADAAARRPLLPGPATASGAGGNGGAGVAGGPSAAVAGAALVAAMALAAPAGVALYSAVGSSIYAPRNLLASLPGLALALGWLVTRPRRPVAAVATGLLAVTLAIGAAQFLSEAHRRPPWRQAAALLDARARAGEPVLQLALFPVRDPLGRKPLERSLEIPLGRNVTEVPYGDPSALARAAGGAGRVWVVVGQIPGLGGADVRPRVPPAFRPLGAWRFDGFAPVSVYEYAVRR